MCFYAAGMETCHLLLCHCTGTSLVSGPGASACSTACAAGRGVTSANKLACLLCPPGTYAAGLGGVACVPCGELWTLRAGSFPVWIISAPYGRGAPFTLLLANCFRWGHTKWRRSDSLWESLSARAGPSLSWVLALCALCPGHVCGWLHPGLRSMVCICCPQHRVLLPTSREHVQCCVVPCVLHYSPAGTCNPVASSLNSAACVACGTWL